MPDTLTQSQRSFCMSLNKSKGTSPELLIKKLLRSIKLPFASHRKNLPGCPDFVFSKLKKIIFINGCFWHRHKCKKGQSMPATRKEFWQDKFHRTIERDKINKRKLNKLGWDVLIIWECEIKKRPEKVALRIERFLGNRV